VAHQGCRQHGKTSLSNWADKRVTILGLGKSGRAAAEYMAKHGAQVLVSEAKEFKGEDETDARALKEIGVDLESGGHSARAIEQADIIITSPGIKPDSPPILSAKALGKKVISDIEVAFLDATMPVVAITGTNGKSTTTAWISFILERAGLKAPACGNFGVPILSTLLRNPDYLIVEVSSFQLYYTDTFAPHIAVWMNLTPDHLDWHGSLEEYTKAKTLMFNRQKSGQFAVLNIDDAIVSKTQTKADVFPFSMEKDFHNSKNGAWVEDGRLSYRCNSRTEVLNPVSELQVIGRHNVDNALASICVTAALGLQPEQIKAGLKEFKGLEHRLEYIGTVSGVSCYNDSKATNPESAIKALEAFKEKIVLIAGGKDKNTALDEFVRSVRNHAAAVILLGEAKERFEKALKEGGVQNIYSVANLEQAVSLGIDLHLGPLVLSPACASYDMFRDFENRGSVFKDIIHARQVGCAPSPS
jgi:UDP-N-acetylmuramoylalanine--D-glutamate ligase